MNNNSFGVKNMSTISVTKTLDVKNLSCPLPILKTKKTITALNVGDVLEVLATDPGSISDITSWAKTTGQELLSHEEIDGKPKIFRFLIRKLK